MEKGGKLMNDCYAVQWIVVFIIVHDMTQSLLWFGIQNVCTHMSELWCTCVEHEFIDVSMPFAAIKKYIYINLVYWDER